MTAGSSASEPGRILVAGAFAVHETLITALQVAITTWPEGTLVYRRGDQAGEEAAEWWAAQHLPFEHHEPEPITNLQFIQANQLVLGDDDHPPADLVLASVTGWLAFGRACIYAAGRAGIPVIRIDT